MNDPAQQAHDLLVFSNQVQELERLDGILGRTRAEIANLIRDHETMDRNWTETRQREEIDERLERLDIIAAGCDPDDPDSHDYQYVSETHTSDGRVIGYKCSRCGAEDSS